MDIIQKKILKAFSIEGQETLNSILVNLSDSEFSILLNELSRVYQSVNAGRDANDPLLIEEVNKTHSVLIAPNGDEFILSKKGQIPKLIKCLGIRSRNKTNQRQLTSEDIVKSSLDGYGGFSADFKKQQNKSTGGAIDWG
ncbi:MAG: hypothetical protein HRT53_21040 [Colwellia sp.]|nr:hypothetical protein [Colwellia sp.]